MSNNKSIGKALIAECERRLFGEALPKIRKCLSELTRDEIWFRPNPETVSVGNLVLHLCGNVRQWIISSLGGAQDIRKRSKEFSETGPIPTAELLTLLEGTMKEARSVMLRLDPSTLLDKRVVRGSEESGLGILVHVVEHFSYHVGQIVYFVKSRKAIDLAFYKRGDLSKRNSYRKKE